MPTRPILLKGKVDGEPTALNGLALDRYRSAMGLDDAMDDGQTQAAARRIDAGAAPIEALEDVRLIGSRYADARVLHPNPYLVASLAGADRD